MGIIADDAQMKQNTAVAYRASVDVNCCVLSRADKKQRKTYLDSYGMRTPTLSVAKKKKCEKKPAVLYLRRCFGVLPILCVKYSSPEKECFMGGESKKKQHERDRSGHTMTRYSRRWCKRQSICHRHQPIQTVNDPPAEEKRRCSGSKGIHAIICVVSGKRSHVLGQATDEYPTPPDTPPPGRY